MSILVIAENRIIVGDFRHTSGAKSYGRASVISVPE